MNYYICVCNKYALIYICVQWQSKDRNKPLCLLVTGNNGREFAKELGEQLHRFTTLSHPFETVESTPKLTYEELTGRLEQVGDIRLQVGHDGEENNDHGTSRITFIKQIC